MRFIFADSSSKLKDYTEKGWLYFFLTQLQPNDRQAFIKFGLTERSLIERLEDYGSLNMTNIYAIRMPCEELGIREGAMKQVFSECKCNENVNIWKDHGVEFLKGDLDLMLRIFLYFCVISLDEANAYKSKQRTIEQDKLLSWLNSLPSIEIYNINRLSSLKIRKMIPEVDNILDVSKEMIKPIMGSLNIEQEEDLEEELAKCICFKCKKICKDKRGLTLHLKSCEGLIIHTCGFCNKVFANSYNLSMHHSRCSENKKATKNREQLLLEENKLLKDQLKELELEVQDISNKYILKTKYYEELYLKDNENIKLKYEIKNLLNVIKTKDNKIYELELLIKEANLYKTQLEEDYTIFLESFSNCLLEDISVWIHKSFYELGRFIGKNIKDNYHLESDSKDELYIIVHSDNDVNKKVSVKKLKHYIETQISPLVEEEQINDILDKVTESKIDKIKIMHLYLKNPTLKETEEIMTGIVSY